MTYAEFAHVKPELAGCIVVNENAKEGFFRPKWNHYANALHYQYYTKNGRKGTGGFTLGRAYALFQAGRLQLSA
jgi:hypothetical protein